MSSSANLWVLLGLGIAGIVIVSQRLKRVIKKDFGAFVLRLELLPPPPPPPPKAPHPLTGLTFAVADIFDISGYVTGFGHEDWARTHEPAEQTSAVISSLTDGGAKCVGKTVIDEMAFGFTGENKHFGAPTNPAAPERTPGGCCSGSAVAVASGLVDFSLGIDTTGGIRVPAAFCGILGFRSSHGVLSNAGVLPVSPSLDTIGWFANDPSILRRIGQLLLQLPSANSRNPRRIIIADDCFPLSKIPVARVTQVVVKSTEKLFGRQVLGHVNLGNYIGSKVHSLKLLDTSSGASSFVELADAMKALQRNEFANNHLKWINGVNPVLDCCIPSSAMDSSNMSDKLIFHCQSARNEARQALNALLKDDGILVLPTSLGPPPKLSSKEIVSADYQTNTMSLLAIASMSGCCQATIPLGLHNKCPVSVSFIARHGADLFLLDTIQSMYPDLQEQADIVSKSNVSSSGISQEESAELAKEKGNNAYKAKQWQKAVNFYTEAIKLDGKNATYYSNRAAVYLELASYVQAEADCTMAISLDRKNVKAYLRRGTAREMLGYHKEAIEDFRYALVLEPTNKTAIQAANRLKALFQ